MAARFNDSSDDSVDGFMWKRAALNQKSSLKLRLLIFAHKHITEEAKSFVDDRNFGAEVRK